MRLFRAIVNICKGLQRLEISGFLTDKAFDYIGIYAKNLETLSMAFVGSSNLGMECVLRGCPKPWKLEIRDIPFGNYALLSGLQRYESMHLLWMSSCKVMMSGFRYLAQNKPRLDVETQLRRLKFVPSCSGRGLDFQCCGPILRRWTRPLRRVESLKAGYYEHGLV